MMIMELIYDYDNAYDKKDKNVTVFIPQVVRVDPKLKVAILEDGTSIGYDKCLIATGIVVYCILSSCGIKTVSGGKPKMLPTLEKSSEDVLEKVSTVRKIEDFKYLDEITNKVK